ncbi:nitronate monooxygenase [uncultured Alistipes sp.]|jgi:dioxygenases related to 2-nitropropane dioxygenase|uniref:NAD(P)H-dependent flavin oxidoreductase n=1 Tax=uncultured Alistipes sp. TaxID=538949 RepID=UPI0025E85185|nr:nitronate monooxygenase [uncultured Alistipes sp.]
MKALKIGNLLASTPIVQGGMGVGVSLSGLAAAVANQGGIGVISSAGLGVIYNDYSKDYREASVWGLKQELMKAREATKGIVGVNVMVAMSNFADMVKTAIAEKADIIFSGAGLPLNLPSFLTEGAKTKLAPIVSSARAAKVLCQKWLSEYKYIPDAIVVEGPKAGGHLGYKEEQIADEHFSLETIVPEIVAEVRAFEAEHNCHIPVIAGGGIYTGEDIYRIMELGAEGVQMGTRFVTTDECDADPAFKQSYLDATQQDIEIILSPVGMPGRAIRSKFLDRVKEGLKRPKNCPFDCIKTCDVTRSPYCIMLALYNAFKGKLQNGYAFCGSNAWRAEKIQSVKELMATLKTEYDNFSLKEKVASFKADCENFSLKEKIAAFKVEYENFSLKDKVNSLKAEYEQFSLKNKLFGVK